ncbi:MAG: thioredoxin domain-containing protein, partial [Acidimicrobiia bacterium]
GLFALYQATGETKWYIEAERLTRAMLDLFVHDGRIYSTGADAEELITRPVDQMDNPVPSGSSLAVEALVMLALYTGEGALLEAAEEVIRGSAVLVEQYPSAVGHLLSVLSSLNRGYREVATVGPNALELGRVVWEQFNPAVVLAQDPHGNAANTIPLLADRYVEGQTLAYVCEGFVCQRPVTTTTELRAQLR